MEKVDERLVFLQYVRLIKEKGDKDKIREGTARCRAMMKRYPEDEQILEAYLSLVKERSESEEEIEEALRHAISWVTKHPEDNAIRSILLDFIRERRFLEKHVKPTLADAEEYMRKHGPHPLFGSYMKLVEKIIKNEIAIDVNFDLVRHFCYDFIRSPQGKKNIPPIIEFAELLSREGRHTEAEKIYEDLSKVDANPGTMSAIYLSQGKKALGEAMDSKLIHEQRMEKLKKAREKIQIALGFHRGHYIAHMFLSIVSKEEGDEKGFEKELGEAERWNRIAKENQKRALSAGEIPYKIGNFYHEFNRHEEAVYWFNVAKEKDSNNFVNWWKLGSVHMEQASVLEKKGFPKEAKALYEEAKSELEMAYNIAPKPLQLPASEDIPNLINECKKHLQGLDKRFNKDAG